MAIKQNERKAPIYHISLTSYYLECPKCKYRDIGKEKYDYRAKCYYQIKEDACPECGQPFTWDDDEMDRVCKKSKDVIECDKLCLTGAVRKNDKGKWEEVDMNNVLSKN